jgi:CubicO group peptidase (beta-lactamase class C family)/D-alanyl-D-alanine dipeptidase
MRMPLRSSLPLALLSLFTPVLLSSHCRADSRTTFPTYESVIRALEPFIERQVREKELPALSIALVDDQAVVWSKGFGFANPKDHIAATANTVYRVGSVSKLFTDMAVMQLVEEGKLDLDAPITRYLPDFKPRNPFRKPITLRQLMAHRSGLVREPPLGNYFDPSGRSLADMVQSLNDTELVYPPESRIKYSNAGVATVGYVLERTQKEPFARYLKRRLLDRLGMTHSSFGPSANLDQDLAVAMMWTYIGREFEAPKFQLGMAPAGSMYSTAIDLARFLSVLFARGVGPNGPVLQPATLEQMWKPQFAKSDEKTGFGLGFHLAEFEGRRRAGHNGAIYGFATELDALPDDKLGVVVIASRDAVNAVTQQISETALRLMLAARQAKPLPAIPETAAVEPALARKLAGRYQAGDKAFDLMELAGKLWLLPRRGGFRMELRQSGNDLIVDDRLAMGMKVVRQGDQLQIGKDTFNRVAGAKPEPAPSRWRGLIGEYGWDYNTLYLLEKDGKLHALIEWFFLYPLSEVSENVYRFPGYGLYQDEKLVFTRDSSGRPTGVVAANVVFPRRHIDGEDGATFKIKPLYPIDELRRQALATTPPHESGEFRPSDLVDLTTLDDTIRLDIRYATTNNFLSTPMYQSAKAYMQRPAAEALARVNKGLASSGYGLLIHDAYRPWYVTKMFWEATPPAQRIFVADPAKGSRHNRGCAVDLTLYDLKTGKPIEMVGGYDEMSDRSYPGYLGGTALERWHRDFLRHAMEEEGFSVYEAEWWHFDYKDWKQYRIGTQTFEEIAAAKGK